FVVVAIPYDEIANTVRDGRLGPEAEVAHQITDVGEGLLDVSGLHRQHILYRHPGQLFLQKRDHIVKLLRMMIADIVDLCRHMFRALVTSGTTIDKARYY